MSKQRKLKFLIYSILIFQGMAVHAGVEDKMEIEELSSIENKDDPDPKDESKMEIEPKTINILHKAAKGTYSEFLGQLILTEWNKLPLLSQYDNKMVTDTEIREGALTRYFESRSTVGKTLAKILYLWKSSPWQPKDSNLPWEHKIIEGLDPTDAKAAEIILYSSLKSIFGNPNKPVFTRSGHYDKQEREDRLYLCREKDTNLPDDFFDVLEEKSKQLAKDATASWELAANLDLSLLERWNMKSVVKKRTQSISFEKKLSTKNWLNFDYIIRLIAYKHGFNRTSYMPSYLPEGWGVYWIFINPWTNHDGIYLTGKSKTMEFFFSILKKELTFQDEAAFP